MICCIFSTRSACALARSLNIGQGDFAVEQQLEDGRDFRGRPGGRPPLASAAVAADELAGAHLAEAEALDRLAVRGRFHNGDSSDGGAGGLPSPACGGGKGGGAHPGPGKETILSLANPK